MSTENWDEKDLIIPKNESDLAEDVDLLKDEESPSVDVDYESIPAEVREKRERFFQKLNGKFMTMAMAGFLTLGGGWQESFADQLKIKINPDNSMAFELETGVTAEKLEAFRQKLTENEPAVLEWIEQYKQDFRKQLDGMESQILSHLPKKDRQEEKELNAEEFPEHMVNARIKEDHRILTSLRSSPQTLKKYNKFLADHLDDIIISAMMMQDSREAREQLVQNVEFPKIVFNYHSLRTLASPTVAYTEFMPPSMYAKYEADKDKSSLPPKLSPTVFLTPSSFLNDGKKDMDVYVDAIIHEIMHTTQMISKPGDLIEYDSKLFQVLEEGITQYMAFETAQYFSSKYPELKIKITAGSSEYYDRRLIIAAIMESVLSSSRQENVLAEWSYLRADDKKLSDAFRESVKNLKLDSSIADDLDKLIASTLSETKFLNYLLAKLKLADIELSPDFIKRLLTDNRIISPGSLEKISKNLNYMAQSVERAEKVLQEAKPK